MVVLVFVESFQHDQQVVPVLRRISEDEQVEQVLPCRIDAGGSGRAYPYHSFLLQNENME